MSVKTVADDFTAKLRAGDTEAAEKHWSDDVVSIEAMDGPMKECRGLKAVRAKGAWWYENHEIHSFEAEGPFLNGDQFALLFRIDVTRKENGERVKMNEVGLYTVRGGKIVEERFFY